MTQAQLQRKTLIYFVTVINLGAANWAQETLEVHKSVIFLPLFSNALYLYVESVVGKINALRYLVRNSWKRARLTTISGTLLKFS